MVAQIAGSRLTVLGCASIVSSIPSYIRSPTAMHMTTKDPGISSSRKQAATISVATFNVHYQCQHPTNARVAMTILESSSDGARSSSNDFKRTDTGKTSGRSLSDKTIKKEDYLDTGSSKSFVDVVCMQETNETWEVFLTPLLCHAWNVFFHNQPGNPWGGFAVLIHKKSNFEMDATSGSKNTLDITKHLAGIRVLPPLDPHWYPAGLIMLREKICSQSPSSHAKPPRRLQLLNVHLRAPVEVSPHKPYWWGGHANWVGGYFSKRVKQRRLDEIQSFANALDPKMPAIILGDFNECGSKSPCLTYLKDGASEFTVLPKQAISTGFADQEHTSTSIAPVSYISRCVSCHANNSWRLTCCGRPVLSLDYDHIVISAHYLKALSPAMVHNSDSGSDHRMVSAILEFST